MVLWILSIGNLKKKNNNEQKQPANLECINSTYRFCDELKCHKFPI